ncbi:hypothetical protein [Nocardioides sp.]|uniref:hypothetical protein n=1 Tax=Nocardioides sp. TaxID=35761 RepID=UPI00271821BA|nr:hypothetical protein [Nocardioides sp.]MDO9456209.1 hypothetical protein [Nocardioides sp.]
MLGALVGSAAVLTHGRPTGLVLGLVASAAGAYALRGGWSLRFSFTTGWVAVLAYALLPRASGGYLIGSDARGYTLLVFGLVLMLFGIVTVRPLRPPAATTAGGNTRSLD